MNAERQILTRWAWFPPGRAGFLLRESLVFRIILQLTFDSPILKSRLQKAVFRILRAFSAVFHAWAIKFPAQI